MDKDEFQAWKDSPTTQWVHDRLKEIAARVEEGMKARLFESTCTSAAEWAALQGQASFDAGYVKALLQVFTLEYSEISEEDEKIDA